jgi:two-component sensor histidine kinase
MSDGDERNIPKGTAREVAEQFEAGALDNPRLALEETQRRFRNTFATIRSILRQTADSSETVEQFASHLEGRIDALARIQFGLARDPTAGSDLAGLISEELLSCAVREGKHFTMCGPAVRLPPKTAESMGLAIHELATNAVKYGAFSAPRGRVDIGWLAAPRGNHTWLKLDWKESGMRGRPVVEGRRGFGTTLLQEALAYDIGAEVKRIFEPSGFRCAIAFPLPIEFGR